MRLVTVLFTLSLLFTQSVAVKFVIKSLETKCVGEDVQANELLVGHFAVEPKSATDVQMKVYSPTAETIQSRVGSDSGKFAVTTTVSGDHQVCFTNTGSMDRVVGFTLEVGASAKNYDDIAKKENLKPLELELKRIEDMVIQIEESLIYLKEREETMRNTNGMSSYWLDSFRNLVSVFFLESTNSRVMFFSIFSILVLVGLGIWQIIYLRDFFVSKKMI